MRAGPGGAILTAPASKGPRVAMIDIFVSHVEEDRALAEEVAHSLEAAGYTTWYYERDSPPGTPYLLTVGRAITRCRAILVIISPVSLAHGHQVTTEVFQAYEGHKRFFPLLAGVRFEDYRDKQPEWHIAAAGAVAVALPEGGVPALVPHLLAGLTEAGITPSGPAGPPPDPLAQSVAQIRTLLNAPDRLPEAEVAIRDLLAAHPTAPAAHRLAGEYAHRVFRTAEAVAAFEEAARLEPTSALAQWDLALAYLQAGHEHDARTRLVRALRLGLDQSRQRHAMTLLARMREGGTS